jgi:hypothetical protein
MKLVRSRFPWDCSIAALSGALELPYEEVSDGFPQPWLQINDREAVGNIMVSDVVNFVTKRGYACALDGLTPHDAPWRPSAFADVHMLWVKLPGNHDIMVNGRMHLPRHVVIWDGETVLDPLTDAPRALVDYRTMEFALGIWLGASPMPRRPAIVAPGLR